MSNRTNPFGAVPSGTWRRRSESAELRKIVSVNTADVGGGAERIAWDLFKGYEQKGHESWLVVGNKKTDDARVMPFFQSPHINYGRYAGRWPQFKQRWAKRICHSLGLDDFEFPYAHHLAEITGSAPDVVHCHNLHGGYFDLRALVRLSRSIPVFLTLHDGWTASGHCALSLGCPKWETGCGRCPDLTLPPAATRDATSWNWRRKERIFRRCRLYVSTPSQWLMDRVQRSILAPAIADSHVIPNGINLQRFRVRCKAESRAKLPLPPEGKLVVFAASQARSNVFKDYQLLRDVIGRLGQSMPALQFVVVGESGETERIGNAMVHHVPFVQPAELARYFQAADLYVHAAKEEVFGLVIAEAMACGTPVVATSVGGIPEVVSHGETGLLVAPHDAAAFAQAVEQVLLDDRLREQLGRHGAVRARAKFDASTMVDRYLTWFSEVLDARPVPTSDERMDAA